MRFIHAGIRLVAQFVAAMALWSAPMIAFAACAVGQQECNGSCIPMDWLCILEPWPGMPGAIPPQTAATPLGPLLYYVNSGVWQWAFRTGVALAVLNGVYAGFTIIRSNGDSGKVDEGKTRFLWSALGLGMLLLAGAILSFLNPFAFQSA